MSCAPAVVVTGGGGSGECCGSGAQGDPKLAEASVVGCACVSGLGELDAPLGMEAGGGEAREG